MITGESVDITEYLDFGFYDWIWFKDNAGLGETKMGRWLGVSHHVGPLMSFWILTSGSKVLSRTMVQRVTNLGLQLEENIARCRALDIKKINLEQIIQVNLLWERFARTH